LPPGADGEPIVRRLFVAPVAPVDQWSL
jgi:hypothetical protein